MSYQVLARKWRPRRFADMVGQEHVVRALVNGLDQGRLHHAFLFSGTRGVGKTTIARILAKSINCEAGVSAEPCGKCASCAELDEGRFIDLIEVDAASRTKVDDTRELLDNVQYAPTRGRFKVYLIDEVHMLSGHSFNALLKTLEEPPPHVKFLLATTEPQKLPVTVLSRCLQFNLKRLTIGQISAQVEKILKTEGSEYDATSVALLARAADGSMRDALSLLDQAIAYGGGKIAEGEVRDMLGSIDGDILARMLTALAAGDAKALLRIAQEIDDHGGDYDAALNELILLLHHVALAQVAPEALDPDSDALAIEFANRMPAEDVQLFYQIGVIGRRDLPLAPDPRTGLEMTLLRMLAFRPAAGERSLEAKVAPGPAKPARPSIRAADGEAPKRTEQTHTSAASPAVPATSGAHDWSALVGQLKLTGWLRELACNMTLDAEHGDTLQFTLDNRQANLLNKEREAELRTVLANHFGRAVKLQITLGNPPAETPAKQRQRQEDVRQQAALDVISKDPNVRSIQEQFNARVNPASVRPKI